MTITGHGVGYGIGVGPVLRMPESLAEPPDAKLTVAPDIEMERVRRASSKVADTLDRLAATTSGETEDILSASALIAKDPAFLERVSALIQSGKTAERAVFVAMAEYRDTLAKVDGYMAQRASDIDDISARIYAELLGLPAPGVPASNEPFVLVARTLSPADTATLNLDLVQGLITEQGGPTSHTAIIARAHDIPAVVGAAEANRLQDGETVIVRAKIGEIVTDPSPAELDDASREIAERRRLLSAPAAPGVLGDGTKVKLLANLGSLREIAGAREVGAEGVGLFRTEFLFMGTTLPPTVEEQAQAFRTVAEAFPGDRVIVRLLDAGADKPLPYLSLPDEENPALGVRGFRALKANPAVLESQLEAVKRASRHSPADLWVMAPMIADADEAAQFADMARSFGLSHVGVMAEIPSIAVMADQVVQCVDFLSIGTNDLAQYTLAADRLGGEVASYLNPWHPAVLRLIDRLGEAASTAEISLSVCGEAAANALLAPLLVGLGATSLSMAPASIPEVRAALLGYSLDDAREAALRSLQARTAASSRHAALGF